MTAVRPGRSRAVTLRSWGFAAFATLLAVGASSCDTVALISFSEREFQGIESPGFTAAAGSCGTGIQDGRATLRFVLLADDGSPIRPDEAIGKGTVSLGAEAMSFRDTAIFETPIELDSPDTTMALRAEQTCTSGECVQSGMECLTAPGLAESAENKRCLRTAVISTEGAVQFESDTTKPQLFGVMYENSGSLEGFLPSDVGDLHPDWDGDGTAEGSFDVTPIPSRASDRTRQSRAALAVLINNWKNAAKNALDEQRATNFGLWEFKGTSTADVISLVDEVNTGDSPWTGNDQTADNSRSEFTQVEGTRANVFMAIDHVLDTGYAPSEYDGYEKTLVVFVDGPDDLRLPQYDADSVIQRATDMGVRMFIVHLDASQVPTTMAGTPVHRDDPRYWNERVDGAPIQQPCTSDAECKNFERCRVPLSYATTAGAPVEITSEGETYCMPERDPVNGRFGPIGEYSRIACETDGGYIYIKEASGIRPRIDWLPFAMDGLWKVDTVVDVLQNRNVDPNQAYLFQTTMGVTLGGTQRSYDFSQAGEPIATDDGADTRAVLFNGSTN